MVQKLRCQVVCSLGEAPVGNLVFDVNMLLERSVHMRAALPQKRKAQSTCDADRVTPSTL